METAIRFVPVASWEDDAQADAAFAALEDAGIAAVLDEGTLAVPQPDAARALEILRAREAAARDALAAEAMAEDEADVACLSCGARIPEYLERCPACGFDFG